MTDQGLAAPIHADIREQAMLNLVPFTCAGRKMADRDIQPDRVGQPLPLAFPQPYAVAVTPATIGADEQRAHAWIQRLAQMHPPAPNAFDGETGGVVITAHIHPSHMLAQIIHPRGNGFALLLIGKIMHVDGLWVARFAPGLPSIVIRPDQFLLFGLDRDDGAFALYVAFHLRVDIPELLVTIRMRGAFESFDVGLQAVAQFMQQTGDRGMTDGVALLSERSSQLPCTLTGLTALVKFRDAPVDGRPRASRGACNPRHTTVSEEQGICRCDHPALLLVEQWKDRCIFRLEIVLAYHTRVVHNIRSDCSSYFLTGS